MLPAVKVMELPDTVLEAVMLPVPVEESICNAPVPWITMAAAVEPVLMLMEPLLRNMPPPLTLNVIPLLPLRATLEPILKSPLPAVPLVVAVNAPPFTLNVAVPVPVWLMDSVRLAPVDMPMAPPELLRKAVPPPATSIIMLLLPVPALTLTAVDADEAVTLAWSPANVRFGLLIVTPADAEAMVSVVLPLIVMPSVSAWALKATLPEFAVKVWLPPKVKVLLLPPVTFKAMADEALVALFSVMFPVPVLETASEPVLFTVMVPSTLLVDIVPELVSVPPAIFSVKADELLPPVGAVADMVPELVKVPAPMDKVIAELVPLEALVDNVPVLDTDVEELVRDMLLPVVVKLPALLKLPVPIFIFKLWLSCSTAVD